MVCIRCKGDESVDDLLCDNCIDVVINNEGNKQ